MVYELRREHPRWGPVRLAHEVKRAGARPALSRMSVYRVLVRHGLIEPQPRDSYVRWERDPPMALCSWASSAGCSWLMAARRRW